MIYLVICYCDIESVAFDSGIAAVALIDVDGFKVADNRDCHIVGPVIKAGADVEPSDRSSEGGSKGKYHHGGGGNDFEFCTLLALAHKKSSCTFLSATGYLE